MIYRRAVSSMLVALFIIKDILLNSSGVFAEQIEQRYSVAIIIYRMEYPNVNGNAGCSAIGK